MIYIKMFAEFGTDYPLWYSSKNKDHFGYIGKGVLPISKKLENDLVDWSKEFDSLLDQNYPPDSKFPSKKMKRLFIARGKKLKTRLQLELGNGYKVNYYPTELGSQ